MFFRGTTRRRHAVVNVDGSRTGQTGGYHRQDTVDERARKSVTVNAGAPQYYLRV